MNRRCVCRRGKQKRKGEGKRKVIEWKEREEKKERKGEQRERERGRKGNQRVLPQLTDIPTVGTRRTKK